MREQPDPIPSFATEAEERAFWEARDSADYFEWGQAERVAMPNLRPTSRAISLRLPVALLERIKIAAHKRDVPYQSLIKVWLAEKADAGGEERADTRPQRPPSRVQDDGHGGPLKT